MEGSEGRDKLKKWNWGAFLLTWIWGAGNNIWIALLALIPGVHLVMAIILGLRGTRMAWEKNRFLDLKEFVKIQKIWTKWGIIIIVISIIASVLCLKYLSWSFKEIDKADARDEIRAADVRSLIAAVNQYKLDNDNKCPESLSQLMPKYLDEIPSDPNGSQYFFRQDSEECIVSAALEDPDDELLNEDNIAGNGNSFDLRSEDINKLKFYNE